MGDRELLAKILDNLIMYNTNTTSINSKLDELLTLRVKHINLDDLCKSLALRITVLESKEIIRLQNRIATTNKFIVGILGSVITALIVYNLIGG